MARFAIVDPTGDTPRIERYFDLPDGQMVLPFVETADEPAEGQIAGSAEVTVEAGFVRSHVPAVRALKGLVAQLGEDGAILRTFDLGDQPVQATDDIVPYAEVRPEFDPETEVQEGPKITGSAAGVTMEWSVRKKTKKELAAEDADRKEAAFISRFGELGLQVAFDQENRFRLLEGKDRLSLEAFKQQLKSTL